MSHGAGAAGFPTRNRAALAPIFFMHIAALLAWMQQRRPLPAMPETQRVVSILLQPQAIRKRQEAGVITYRRRIGNTTICRRSGNVNPLGMRSMLLPGDAGDVPCPTGVQWKRD